MVNELAAMQSVFDTLDPLDEAARVRVLAWVTDRLGIKGHAPSRQTNGKPLSDRDELVASEFATFADLCNAASPSTNAEKALVAGYWLQVYGGHEQFTSQVANKELQNLGHVLPNITDAFTQLKDKKPALAIQVRKSGKSRQARKQYKLTQAGIATVDEMIQRGSAG